MRSDFCGLFFYRLLFSLFSSAAFSFSPPEFLRIPSSTPPFYYSCSQIFYFLVFRLFFMIDALCGPWRYASVTPSHFKSIPRAFFSCVRPFSWNSLPLHYSTLAFDSVLTISKCTCLDLLGSRTPTATPTPPPTPTLTPMHTTTTTRLPLRLQLPQPLHILLHLHLSLLLPLLLTLRLHFTLLTLTLTPTSTSTSILPLLLHLPLSLTLN